MPTIQPSYSLIIAALLALLGSPLGPPAAHADVTAAQVENSIRRGMEYLEKRQLGTGGWDEYLQHNCGLTALCTLSLVTAGMPPESPTIKRAMNYLRKKGPVDTYSVALQTLVFCQVGAAEDQPLIRRNVRWLESKQVPAGAVRRYPGAWGYGNVSTSGDPSNTQFALLALSAAEESGIAVSPQVFALSLEYWKSRQHRFGGWPYISDLSSTGSMTSAAIASIIICRGRLTDDSSRINGEKIQCCGGGSEDEVIERGLQWLAENFTVRSNPGATGASPYLYYYLYALERVGRYTGRRMIGDHDWYREGAEVLLRLQDDLGGSWRGESIENNRFVATSFALLFLAKGKRQVALGRLDYSEKADADGKPGLGNQHPEGPRQLVRHLERDWGRDLTWQTIRLKGATVGDLLQAPVLLITGNEPLKFDAAARELLKAYIEGGGFILFEAAAGDGCGPAAPFERSVNALCQEMFGSPLERLPPGHPIWYAERRVDPTAIGENFWVYGVQACCRTGIAYVPRALTCRWELNDPTSRTNYAPVIQNQLDAAVSLGQNIIAYATGRELKDKLETRSVLVQETTARAGERGVVAIPRVALDAGGEDARRAIPNLARYVDDYVPMRITTETPLVPINADALEAYPIAWMHGRRGFELTPNEVDELRTFLERGGTLLVDSICGDPAFTQALRAQLARVLPDSPLTPLSPDAPLLSSSFGFDLGNVTLRIPQRSGSGAITVQKRQTSAVLETASIDDRVAVIFSPYDLSCALESQSSIQCPGYTTEDAVKIGINMLLYSLLQ